MVNDLVKRVRARYSECRSYRDQGYSLETGRASRHRAQFSTVFIRPGFFKFEYRSISPPLFSWSLAWDGEEFYQKKKGTWRVNKDKGAFLLSCSSATDYQLPFILSLLLPDFDAELHYPALVQEAFKPLSEPYARPPLIWIGSAFEEAACTESYLIHETRSEILERRLRFRSTEMEATKNAAEYLKHENPKLSARLRKELENVEGFDRYFYSSINSVRFDSLETQEFWHFLEL
ncbi:MAG TPA: hypothetical protein PKC98_04695 [Candidatus Melainabacteria bacterium]|nr:hypothetical protein [Candidatus Melainabacteria bacterium]